MLVSSVPFQHLAIPGLQFPNENESNLYQEIILQECPEQTYCVGPNLGTAQVSTSRKMHKQVVMPPHNVLISENCRGSEHLV